MLGSITGMNRMPTSRVNAASAEAKLPDDDSTIVVASQISPRSAASTSALCPGRTARRPAAGGSELRAGPTRASELRPGGEPGDQVGGPRQCDTHLFVDDAAVLDVWAHVDVRREMDREPGTGAEAIKPRARNPRVRVVERRRRPACRQRAAELQRPGRRALGRDAGLAVVRAAIGEKIETLIREPPYRPRRVREVEPTLHRPLAVTVERVVVEKHPDGRRDTQVTPLLRPHQLHFDDARPRAVGVLGDREVAPHGELRAAPVHPGHRLDHRTIADHEPAVGVSRAESPPAAPPPPRTPRAPPHARA